MRVIFCLTSFFLTLTLGQVLSPSELQEYIPDEQSALDSVADKVAYYLYTNEDKSAFEITKNDSELLASSTFDPAKKTKVLIHGFINSYKSKFEQEVSQVYLINEDVNIVTVQWQQLAFLPYNIAVYYTLPVGKEVAQLIDFLVTAGGANVSDIHIIGHSLGAHISSFAANHVTSGNITRISGLDPALPLFMFRDASERLDPTDADVVDCIHTCGGLLGFYKPICTHDFYPNGGTAIQPDCGIDLGGSCSHSRSFSLYATSVIYNFTAQACTSMAEVKQDLCTGSFTGLMGEPAATTSPGIYILETTGEYPYVKN